MGMKCNWSHPLLFNSFSTDIKNSCPYFRVSYNTTKTLKQTEIFFLFLADNLNLTSKAKFKMQKIMPVEEQEKRELQSHMKWLKDSQSI